MSTPTPRTDEANDGGGESDASLATFTIRRLQSQLTTALARVAELEKRLDQSPFGDDKIDELESCLGFKTGELDSLTRQLSEAQAKLASAREDMLRMDKAEELCSEFNCTSDATDFFLILPKTRDNEHGPKIFNPTLRSAIDSARGHLAETPAGGEMGKDAWQPIATAPKDGTEVLLLFMPSEQQCVGEWWGLDKIGIQWRIAHVSGPEWEAITDELQPTHWQPLPPPPQGKETRE